MSMAFSIKSPKILRRGNLLRISVIIEALFKLIMGMIKPVYNQERSVERGVLLAATLEEQPRISRIFWSFKRLIQFQKAFQTKSILQ